MDSEELKGQARRESVIKSGLERFRQFGIRKVPMGEIARSLRMSKKTLYQIFSSKEDLVAACAGQVQSLLFPKMLDVLAAGGTPGQKLLRIFKVIEIVPRFMSKELMQDLQTDYPHLWEQIDARRQRMFEEIEKLVREGIETGELRPQIHPGVFRRFIVVVANGVLTPEALSAGGFSPEDVLRTMMTINKHGLFSQPVEEEGKKP